MFERFFRPPASSFFLFGPRGTGKTTWLAANYPDALWIDLIDPENIRFYGAAPERLRQTLAANPSKRTVIIDEVKRVPQLLQVVHQLIERDKSLVFVLTGSSARQLKSTGIDLLAGRAVLRAYAALCVREEVQMEGLVRNAGGFSRFLEAVSIGHASVLNISNIARECQVERKVVTSQVEILQDLPLAFTLPVFVRRARRALRPKDPLDSWQG